MNGPDRYKIAETLLGNLRRELPSGISLHTPEQQTRMIAEAQVHATLALVAATVDAANRMVWTANQDGNGHEIQNSLAWAEVTA